MPITPSMSIKKLRWSTLEEFPYPEKSEKVILKTRKA
jgi:hypothetical protein